jgi:hypothetical protein
MSDKSTCVSFRLNPKELGSLEKVQLKLAAELGISRINKGDAFKILLRRATEK